MTSIERVPPPLPIEIEPWYSRETGAALPSGSAFTHRQWVYRFANGYGASVAQGTGMYGGRDDSDQHLYELAVLRFTGPDPGQHEVLTDRYDAPECVHGPEPGCDCEWTCAPAIPHAPWLSPDLTGDVHGWQALPEVAALLVRIAAIPAPPVTTVVPPLAIEPPEN